MKCLYLSILFLALTTISSSPALAGGPSEENCSGRQIDVRCYNRATNKACGAVIGATCYSSIQNTCGVKLQGFPCTHVMPLIYECEQTFPGCCTEAGCAISYSYRVGFHEYSGSFPDGFTPQ